MKIVHCCLSNFYVDGFSYQENELVAQNVRDGHDVTVIASTETFGADRQLAYLKPAEYLGDDGARVIRIPYRAFLPKSVMKKLRAHPAVFDLLGRLKPDVILFHGTCGWELNAVARYKRANPATLLYVDSHEDFNNSARTWISKWGLHYLYYRLILRNNLKWIDKILCVNMDAISFVNQFYGVPSTKLEFFPLGGQILGDDEYREIRLRTREFYGVGDDELLFVQSGKIDRSKKLLESLRAFLGRPEAHLRFIIVGHLHDEIAQEAEALISRDRRVRFLGWKASTELRDLLCAADVYVQPGTQSATMQMSLCCRCAVMLDNVSSHGPYLDGNGWLVGNKLSLDEAFSEAAQSAVRIASMSKQSAGVASRLLDYRSLAARLYR